MSNEATTAAAPNTNTPAAVTPNATVTPDPVIPAAPATVVETPPATLLTPAVAAVVPDPAAPAAVTTATEKVDPPAAPTKVVPEKYEIKLPEGSPLDQSAIDRISADAKAKGLSNDEAQSELNRESASAASYLSTLSQKSKEIQGQWVQTAQKDPEIGGANFQVSVEHAQRALNQYGSESLKQELNKTGFGNHPELIRVFARIGKAMADDTAVRGGLTPNFSKNRLDILYDKKE